MINVMLDPLPTEWESSNGTIYLLNTDFRIGIQLFLIQEDTDITENEKFLLMKELLLEEAVLIDAEDMRECISFFLNGWYQDNKSNRNENGRIMSFDVDQWRIYSAFLAQYRIDLNEIEYLHFWKFMGLLTTLQECAYTRVIDIRQRKIRPKMDAEERKQLNEAKAVYRLPELRTLEEREMEADIYDFLGGEMSEAEKKRVSNFEKYADIEDDE